MKNETIIKILNVFKFVVLLGIIIGIPLAVYLSNPEFLSQFKSMADVEKFLVANAGYGYIIYIGLLILEIVVSVIPSQVIQIAAGFAFPIPIALILTILGAAIGSTIAFFMARYLGKGFIYMLFGEEKIKKFIELLTSKKGLIAIFLIFFIPGIPKDIFTYAAGVSTLKWHKFLAISIVARTPSFLASILVGNMYKTHSYIPMIIIAIVVVIIFAVGVVKREAIYDKIK